MAEQQLKAAPLAGEVITTPLTAVQVVEEILRRHGEPMERADILAEAAAYWPGDDMYYISSRVGTALSTHFRRVRPAVWWLRDV